MSLSLNGYWQRVANNILPLSIEQEDVSKAIKEWFYNENTYDLEKDTEKCQLCDHPDIRYQFEIFNKNNGNELLVGSECIKKFDIETIDENGRIWDPEETRKRVEKDRRKLIKDSRERRMFITMVKHARAVETQPKPPKVKQIFDIFSFIDYREKRGVFTPHQLFTLFWLMGEYKISYQPTDFKLSIKKPKEKEWLKKAEKFKIDKLWECMSDSQQKWYNKHKISGQSIAGRMHVRKTLQSKPMNYTKKST